MTPGGDKTVDSFLDEKIQALGEIDGYESYGLFPRPTTAEKRRAKRKVGASTIEQRKKKDQNRRKNKMAKASRKKNRG